MLRFCGLRGFAVGLAVLGLAACGGGGASLKMTLLVSETTVRSGELGVQANLEGADGVDRAELLLDGEPYAELKRLDATLTLSTLGMSDGEHELQVVAYVGKRRADAVTVVTIQNPSARVTRIEAPEMVVPGETFTISVETTGAVSGVSADVRGFDAQAPSEGVQGFATSAVTWAVTYTVPAAENLSEGWYDVPLRVRDANERTLRVSDLRVYLAAAPLLPLRSELGVFERGSLPEASADADAEITAVSDDNLSVVSGGEVVLALETSGDLQDAQVLVAVDGYAGHLVLPVALLENEPSVAAIPAYAAGLRPGAPHPQRAVGRVLVPLLLPLGALPDGTRDMWTLLLAIRDASGRVSNIVTAVLAAAEAQAGQLRVSLSWDSATDVDLHVVEPGGSEIYYGNRSGTAGGQLDLDSNASCSIDGVNQENIFWDLPPNGEYVVRVDFWSDCPDSQGNGLPANWRAVVSGCGIEESAEGSFAAGTATHGGAGDGVEALRFTADCQPLLVRGTAKYERKLPITGARQSVVLEGTPVRVVDEVGTVLGESIVGPQGAYAVLFDAPSGGPDAKVGLEFEAADALVRVLPLSGDSPYVYRDGDGSDGHTWKPADEAVHERDVLIKAEASAGAMHLFMMARRALTWGAGRGYASGDAVTVRWTLGQESADCTSCYSSSSDTLWVGGTAADPDQFDDPVVGHELGHRMHDKFGRNDQPGGDHSRFSRIAPPFAFGEGFATYIGQRVHGDAQYYDSFRGGVSKWRLDALEARVPKGTDDATSQGKMSEAVVAAIMWELYDPAATTGDDRVGGFEDAMLRHALVTMKQDEALGRGTVDKTDLPDLIGGLACGLLPAVKTDIDRLLQNVFEVDWLDEAGFCR